MDMTRSEDKLILIPGNAVFCAELHNACVRPKAMQAQGRQKQTVSLEPYLSGGKEAWLCFSEMSSSLSLLSANPVCVQLGHPKTSS